MIPSISRFILMIFLSAIAATSIVLYPPAIIAICGVLSIAFLSPRSLMIGLAIFFPFQSLIAYQFSTTGLAPEFAINFIDEAVILYVFTIITVQRLLRSGDWERSKLDIPIIILIIIGTISTVASRIVPITFACSDLFLLIKGFMVFYIFRSFHFKEQDLRKILKILCVMACFIVFLGGIDLLFPAQFRHLVGNIIDIEYRFNIPSVTSIFTQPGVHGWFMAFVCCYSFAFYIFLEKNRHLYFTIIFALSSILSMRFKPIGGLAAAFFTAYLLIQKNKRIRITLFMGLILTIIVAVFGEKILALGEEKLYSYVSDPFALNHPRNALYLASINIAKDYFPLGSGFASFGGFISGAYYSPLYVKYGLSKIWGLEQGGHFLTDTFWPYILGELGILGLICYVWVLCIFFKKSFDSFKNLKSPFFKAFALGTIMIFIEAVIESAAEPVFVHPPEYFFIFAAIGILYSLGEDSHEEPESEKQTLLNKA